MAATYPSSVRSLRSPAANEGVRFDDVANIAEEVIAIETDLLETPTAYTPTWSGTLGNGTIAGKYTDLGKRVLFEVLLTWGSTTSHAAAVQTFSLPVTAAAADRAAGTSVMVDSGTGVYTGIAYLLDTTHVVVYNCGGIQTTSITNIVPFTWATNDVLSITGVLFKA